MPIKSDAIPLFVPVGTSIQLSRKKPNNFGRFQAVGEFSTIGKEAKYDVLEAMGKLSKGAQQLFLKMKRYRDDANRVIMPSEHHIGSYPYKSKMRLCKEIKAMDLIASVTRPYIPILQLEGEQLSKCSLFMLNPHFIKCPQQMDAQIYWSALTRNK
jgi:hypothetical protein